MLLIMNVIVCAIASRYYTERPVYATLMQYAQLAAGTALISGNKNVEMCQAYLLLSVYPLPARKWEDQRTWLYLGLAVRFFNFFLLFMRYNTNVHRRRTATDLNLHLPMTAKPLNENHAREMLNRTRVWLNCLNVERSTASQYGKPSTINPRDYILNNSEDWWKSSPHNMKNFDIHICVYNGELKIMANFLTKIYSDPKHLTGLNKVCLVLLPLL
jgi:Fungal specific transcription factor domain